MINYKRIEELRIDIEQDKRAIKRKRRRLTLLVARCSPGDVKAIRYDQPPQHTEGVSDFETLMEIYLLSMEIDNLEGLLNIEKDDLIAMEMRVGAYLDTTGDAEAYVYEQVYCKGVKNLKDIAEVPPYYFTYGYIRQVHMDVSRQIRGEV